MAQSDSDFVGSIPDTYQRFLEPALFVPYAVDLAARLHGRRVSRVLEIAAGTGVLTRELRRSLPPEVEIVATDLNAAMLETAQHVSSLENVRWQVADAAALPFEAGTFDVIVCQFGVMFFPDKIHCAREARRVLQPGGVFAFNLWDTIGKNPVAHAVVQAGKSFFPTDPPHFYERGPHGYADAAVVEAHVREAGFTHVETHSVDARLQSSSVGDFAHGVCEGSPLRAEIIARDPSGTAAFREALARNLAREFGEGPLDAAMRAHVFLVS